MGLDGGGGGGGILGVGNSFTGPAQALELVGNHAYAYSGPVEDAASGGADTRVLLFTTGNYYSVMELSFVTTAKSGGDQYMNILFNNAVIFDAIWDGGAESVGEQPFNILIPAYTTFELKWGITGETQNISVFMVGRTYRG